MFRKLLSVEEVKQILERNFPPKPVGIEQVPLLEANDRVLAEEIVAKMDVPPFDRATVDGYAVKAEDTFGADEESPVALKLCGCVEVGEPTKVITGNGEAVEIATGAPLPNGADSVIMVEHTIRKGDKILVYTAVAAGENVMKAGSDIRKGEKLLGIGKALHAREIGVLAALGMATIRVFKKAKVAVISTGPEIVQPGKPLLEGKIYDINAYTLTAAVRESGGEPINFGVFPDDAQQLKKTLRKALNLADMVITSGGVSVGPKDIIPQVLNRLGKPGAIVSGIAAKPGKPTTIAIIDGKPVFSLPGHPTSSLLMFHLLVCPVIRGMSGMSVEEGQLTVKAVASTRMFPARGRKTFIMVNLRSDESGRLLAIPVSTGLSGAITTFAKADGFVQIDEKRQFVDSGEDVTVYLLRNA